MKKGQLQMGETIAVMIVIILLLVFSLIIYGKNKENDISKTNAFNKELDVVELSQLVYTLPEIQCSFAEVFDYGCIDIFKLKALSEIVTADTINYEYFYYREIFGTSRISIDRIRPNGDIDQIELYKTTNDWESKKEVQMPIIVYDAVEDRNYFGVLIIEKYS